MKVFDVGGSDRHNNFAVSPGHMGDGANAEIVRNTR
jgi:hypothetical protein